MTEPAGPGPVRFLATGDWQLGMTRHFLDQDAQARYTAARIDVLTRILDVAQTSSCEFVVVCGDVFETNAVSPRVVLRALEVLRDATVPVFLVPGNHDPLDAASVYRSRTFVQACPPQVRVIESTDPLVLRPGVELVAAPWFSKHPRADLVAAAISGLPPDGTVRIVAGHGAVDTLSADRSAPALINTSALTRALDDGRCAVVVLGDRHSLTDINGNGRMFYPGTPEVTDFDERRPGHVLVLQVDDGTVTAEAVQVGRWRFADLSAQLEGDESLTALDRTLTELPARERCVVRLTVTGALTAGQRGLFDDLLDRHRVVLAGLQMWEKMSDLLVVVDDTELSGWGIGGFVQDAVADIAGLAGGSGDQARSARDALVLLHRLSAPGRRPTGDPIVILHRLTLTNFRGVTSRTVAFPETGIVVVHGANETGKSSLIDALDLLLDEKDSSTKVNVRAIKPVDADVGSSVEAEVTVGPYRLVYRKTFNRGPETVLTISGAVTQQLTGATAHERMRAILAESVDLRLWKALRLLQSADSPEAELAGCDSLSRALDRAAGTVADPAGGQAVIDVVEQEYARYFTPTGRPGGALRQMDERLRAARDRATVTATTLAELDAAVRDHDELSDGIAELDTRVDLLDGRLAEVQRRLDAAGALLQARAPAVAEVQAAQEHAAATARTLSERNALVAGLKCRQQILDAIDAEALQLATKVHGLVELLEGLHRRMAQLDGAVADAAQVAEQAQCDADLLSNREQLQRMHAAAAEVARAEAAVDRLVAELDSNRVDANMLAAVEAAAQRSDQAAARRDAQCSRLTIRMAAPSCVDVDGQGIEVPFGGGSGAVVRRLVGRLAVTVPGLVDLELSAPADALASVTAADTAAAELTRLLAEVGTTAVAAARQQHIARRVIQSSLAEARTHLARISGDVATAAEQQAVVDHIARLTDARPPDLPLPSDPQAARRVAAAANMSAHQAVAARAAIEQERRRSTSNLEDARAALSGAEQNRAAQRALQQELAERLAQSRIDASDELLAATAAQSRLRHEDAIKRLAGVDGEIRAAGLAEWEHQRVALQTDRDAAVQSRRRLGQERAQRAALLTVLSGRGVQDEHDDALTVLEVTEREHAELRRRSQAVAVLLQHLRTHRDAARATYVDVFRQQLERLARQLFGENLQLQVDPDLRVTARSLDGRTVDYRNLSTGAREQLALLIRLACATMIDPVDGVPVLFDDILGHTDPARLHSVGHLLAEVADQAACQIIIFTSSPQRYAGIESARFLSVESAGLSDSSVSSVGVHGSSQAGMAAVTVVPYARPASSIGSGAAASASATAVPVRPTGRPRRPSRVVEERSRDNIEDSGGLFELPARPAAS